MRRRNSGIAGTLVFIWLIVGLVAAAQRNYFDDSPKNCAGAGTIIVTTIAGPLNYLGANPRVADCELPQPSP